MNVVWNEIFFWAYFIIKTTEVHLVEYPCSELNECFNFTDVNITTLETDDETNQEQYQMFDQLLFFAVQSEGAWVSFHFEIVSVMIIFEITIFIKSLIIHQRMNLCLCHPQQKVKNDSETHVHILILIGTNLSITSVIYFWIEIFICLMYLCVLMNKIN